jgi:hypothetical protein
MSMTKIAGSGSASGSIIQRIRGMDPRIQIRIHTKMSWIRNSARETISLFYLGCAQRAPTRSAGVRLGARCSPACAPSAARETSPAPATPPHAPEILPLFNPFLDIGV